MATVMVMVMATAITATTGAAVAGCPRPVTIRVWSDYAYGYIYKTIYRSINVCYY